MSTKDSLDKGPSLIHDELGCTLLLVGTQPVTYAGGELPETFEIYAHLFRRDAGAILVQRHYLVAVPDRQPHGVPCTVFAPRGGDALAALKGWLLVNGYHATDDGEEVWTR